MGTSYDKFLKKATQKAKKNRTNRVTRTAKKYNDGELRKSHKQYIAGDIISSASNKAYGYKQSGNEPLNQFTGGQDPYKYKLQQEGKNPYEFKYVYTGKPTWVKGGTSSNGKKYDGFWTKNRLATDEEKELYKKTGELDFNKAKKIESKKYDYKVLDSYDDSSNKFRDKLNTSKLDGLEVAKNRVKNGSNRFEYVKGLLKDTVADPFFDLLRIGDYGESALLGGVLGLGETAKSVSDVAFNHGLNLKDDVNYKQALDNIKASIDSSNKTGWGRSSTEIIKDWDKNANDRRYKSILATDGKESADAYLESVKKAEPITNVANTIVGFGTDIINPFELTSGIVRVGNKVLKDTSSSFNDLRKGTADLSMGIVPKAQRQANQQRLLDTNQKWRAFEKANHVEDEFSSSAVDALSSITGEGGKIEPKYYWKEKNGDIDSILDYEYKRAMANDKDPSPVTKFIKINPSTQELGKFLDEIGTSVDKGRQVRMGNKILNNKTTQVKNDFIPSLSRVDEITDNIPNNIDDSQLTFETSKLIDDFQNMFEASDVPNSKLGKEIFFKNLDKLSDEESGAVFDWLSEYNPKIYNEYLGDVDDIIETNNKVYSLSPNEYKSSNKGSVKKSNRKYRIKDSENTGVNLKDIMRNISDHNLKNLRNVNENYNAKNLEKIKNEINYNAPKPRTEYTKLKESFKNFTNSIHDEINNGNYSFLKKLRKFIDDVDYEKMSTDYSYNEELIEKLNKELFGNDYVRRNLIRLKDDGTVSNKYLKSFIEHLEDVLNYNTTKYKGEYSFKPKGNYPGTKNGVHYMFDRNGKPNEIKLNSSLYSPSIMDELFDDKISHADKLVHIKNKKELTKPIEEIENKAINIGKKMLSKQEKELLKAGESGKVSPTTINAVLDRARAKGLTKLSDSEKNKYANLVRRLEYRQSVYEKVKNMDFDEWNDYIRKFERNDYDSLVKDGIVDIEDISSPIETAESLFERIPVKKSDQGEIIYDYKGILDEDDYKRMLSEEKRKKKIIDYLALDKIYYKELKNIPKGKKLNFSELSKHKEGRKYLKNIKKITDEIIKIEDFSKNADVDVSNLSQLLKNTNSNSVSDFKLKVYREEIRRISDEMKKFGISENTWRKQLDDYIMYRKYNKHDATPLEKFGLTINNKRGVFGSKNKPEFMEELNAENKFKDNFFIEEYEKAINSNNPKDLLNSNHKPRYENEVAQHGDNSSKLSSNKETPLDNVEPKKTRKTRSDKGKKRGSYKPRENAKSKVEDIKPKETPLDIEKLSVDNKELSPSQKELQRILEKEKNRKPNQEILDKIQQKSNVKEELDKLVNEKSKNKKTTTDDKNNNPIYDGYKRWLNTFKKGLTVYNPGWHAQNFLQNKGQNYLAFGADAFGSQKNAKNLLNYLQGKENKVENVIDKKTGEVYDADYLSKLVNKHGVINSQTNDIINSRGIISPLETKVENSKLMKLLGHSEDTSRLYHFITQLERGMTPEEASKSVNKYLFDYNNKSKTDKVISDFVDPFWMFHKNYARLLGQSAIENPSRINNILRAERGLESGLSEDDRNNTSTEWDKIQSPYSSFVDEKNDKTYDYLYKQNIMPRIQDAIPTNQDELENKLNPILRLALQESRGEGNFHNKIVSKDESDWGEITQEERNEEVLRELNPFLNAFFKAQKKVSNHQEKADKGTQSQDTSNKQILLDFIEFITGNKGNYYRR